LGSGRGVALFEDIKAERREKAECLVGLYYASYCYMVSRIFLKSLRREIGYSLGPISMFSLIYALLVFLILRL
jgi:hypothetical protein